MSKLTYSKGKKVRLVCISDTHNHAPGEGYTLPPGGGDILIHAGDLTNQGTVSELRKATSWLKAAKPFKYKIVVAGNHDLALDANYSRGGDGGEGTSWPSDAERREARSLFRCDNEDSGFIYLENESVTLAFPTTNTTTTPLTIFGSPLSPSSSSSAPTPTPQTWAFQYPPQQPSSPWTILSSTGTSASPQILVTHTPAHGLLSTSTHWGPEDSGCRSLLTTLQRIRPLVHVCGHCHEGRGAVVVRWAEDGDYSVPHLGVANHRQEQEEKGEAEVEMEEEGKGYEVVYRWEEDQGSSGKKMAVLDLTGTRAGGHALQAGRETAVVNAAVMGRSWTGKEGAGRKGKVFNKPIVVDLFLPVLDDE